MPHATLAAEIGKGDYPVAVDAQKFFLGHL